MKGLGYGAIRCGFTPGSHTSVGERPGEHQFCNIITIFHIATTSQQGGRWGVCVCLRGCPQSPEGEGRDQRRREGVVCRTLQGVGF